MPRTCTICSHQDRAAIEQQLMAGGAYRPIASQYGVGYKSVQRHASEHVKQQVAEHKEARKEAQALDVVKQLKAINGAALAILSAARSGGKHDLALKAIDRIQRQIELQARLLGDLSDAPQVSLVLAPEWVTFRTVLLRVLSPYAEAKVAAAQALLAAEAGHGNGREHVDSQ